MYFFINIDLLIYFCSIYLYMRSVIKRILKEETNRDNLLKNYFIKKWDREKEKGGFPYIKPGELESLGLTNKRNEILLFYAEYIGDESNSKLEVIKYILLNNTFDENDMTLMKDWRNGKISVKFNDVFFTDLPDELFLMDVEGRFTVLDGTFYDYDSGAILNFSSSDIPFDDFTSYWEFKDAIRDVVNGFVISLLEGFGYDINRHINVVDFEW